VLKPAVQFAQLSEPNEEANVPGAHASQ